MNYSTFFVFCQLQIRFPNQIKAQRSGFDLEATSHDTVGISRLRDMEHCIMSEELVTRTGFEPMLKA